MSPEASIKKIIIEVEEPRPDFSYLSPRNATNNISSSYDPAMYYTAPTQNLSQVYSPENILRYPIQYMSSSAQTITSPSNYVTFPSHNFSYQYTQKPAEVFQPLEYQQMETLQPVQLFQPIERLEPLEVESIKNRFKEKEKSSSYDSDILKYTETIPLYLKKNPFISTTKTVPNSLEVDSITSQKNNLTYQSIDHFNKQTFVIKN